MPEEFVIPGVSQEDYERAGSKFAKPGLHLSEMKMPDWDTPGVSIAFPFRIIEEGDDYGKESKISAGVSKDALWKLKETLKAVGVAVTFKDGKPSFKAAECVGRQFMSLWEEFVDSRPPEAGGKGTKYTKPTSALPVGTKVEDLGI